jgi:hypothetical protein
MSMKLSYVLLLGAVLSVSLLALSQSPSSKPMVAKNVPTDYLQVALVYNPMAAGLINGNSLWMNGVSGQLDTRFWRGLSVTEDFGVQHNGNMRNSGVGLDLVTTTFGPRYSWQRNKYTFYGQMLAGVAFGRNSVFPGVGGPSSTADSLALLGGGGVNRQLNKRFAARLIEADWVYTQLPNSTTNKQNDLRLGAGLVVSIK